MDHARPSVGQHNIGGYNWVRMHGRKSEAQEFYDIFYASQTPMWEGCENDTKLSIILEALSFKSNYNMSQGCFNRVAQYVGNMLAKNNHMFSNFYEARMLVRKLGLGCLEIDCFQKKMHDVL